MKQNKRRICYVVSVILQSPAPYNPEILTLITVNVASYNPTTVGTIREPASSHTQATEFEVYLKRRKTRSRVHLASSPGSIIPRITGAESGGINE